MYFKDCAVLDIDTLEELSLGNFAVGIDVDDETIDNNVNVDNKATEDGVTGAATAAKRERFDSQYFTSDCLVVDLPLFPFVF